MNAGRSWLLMFAAALTLYASTASRDIDWQDFGEYTQRAVAGQLLNVYGLASSHPLHHWLSRAAISVLPVEPPYAAALVSALFGAIAVANVYGIVRQLTGRTAAAVLAAAGLALAHTYWRLSVRPECYTLATALLTFELWALILWYQSHRPHWLVLMMLANGLGFANHNLALLTLPTVGIVLVIAMKKREIGWRTLAVAGVVWFVGASPFIGLVAQQAAVTGDTAGMIRSALVGKYASQASGEDLMIRYTATSVAFTLLSFPNLMLPVAALGIARARRLGVAKPVVIVLLADLGVHLAFVLRYNVIDQYTFLLPAYSLLAIFGGVGFAFAETKWSPRAWRITLAIATALTLLTPLTYVIAEHIARRFQVLGASERSKPYRDDYRYLFLPWAVGETSAARLSAEAMSMASPRGAILVEDHMASFAVRYRMLRNPEADVQMIETWDDAVIAQAVRDGRAVVYVPRRTDRPSVDSTAGRWRRVGDLFVLDVR